MKLCLAAAVLLGCVGFWTLFGSFGSRFLLRYAPRLVAWRRLKRFALSGKKVRVVCFGKPEDGEEPGFHFAFDAVLCGEIQLTALTFSELEPPSAVEMAADFCGRTVGAYCYCNARGLQLIGALEGQTPHFRLSVRTIKLSGRPEEFSAVPER